MVERAHTSASSARTDSHVVSERLDRALLTEDAPFRSLHGDIYSSLRRSLMAGDLVPGQAVSIRTLADEFGTSMIPVRDALKRLVAERALTMLPNRTVVVSPMTRRRFQEILNVRLAVETMLARQAVEFITPADIELLERVDGEMHGAAQDGDVKSYLIANHAFHFTLYGTARSQVMLPIVESLWMQVGPYLNGVFNAAGVSHASDHHATALKAARRRDAIGVADAIGRDLADAADTVLARNDFVAEGAAGTSDRGTRLA
jgi:DNA-binding GntR family transcriptional regulator